ncbi:LysM peptidoglycan-binding domain-containing protein [Xylanibacillus composti]|uniref:Peptidase M14 n=1 Tax=Xylanibacillus composti TaxID=1572762 RepID=A0A8J4H2C9_9BACL|nr:M14 family metallopeptidase [Xylanibacillus composti]MDT9724920.1 LysM peptidoglycan-binding domain-containing protein [Xylanibacillus composti]GIQ68156.1 peptidase M14 [Xylanibacillus composti]
MSFPYLVQVGDNLHRIARKFGINVPSLLAANAQHHDHAYVMPGQILRIPVRPSRHYAVQKGDSYATIAHGFQISEKRLKQINPAVPAERPQEGQVLLIPGQEGGLWNEPGLSYGYVELQKDLNRWKGAYPFLQQEAIGQSVLGREIAAVLLGTGSRRVHVNASVHANEWMTTPLLMKFVDDCAAALQHGTLFRGTDIASLLEHVSLHAVPMVNPDGVELALCGIHPAHPYYAELTAWNNGSRQFQQWKANIRGVDLNDQFPAHWETERERRSPNGPSPRDYAGEAPLSEPEAKALAVWTERMDFHCVVSLHTQGEEIYWNYRGYEPEEAEQLANRLASVSFYRAVKLAGSDAGYKDWFIQRFRRCGFTVECGFGVNPLPAEQFPAMYERVSALLLEAMKAAAVG